MSVSKWFHIDDARIVRRGKDAMLIEREEVGEVWIPYSQISEARKYEPGDVVTLSITEWIAVQKGFEV